MIQQEELAKKIEDEGINVFNVECGLNLTRENAIRLKEVDELIRFCKINEIKNIFYLYIFFHKEDYIVSDEMQEDIEKDIYKLIKKEIKEHNKRVETIDFTRPAFLDVFCMFNDKSVCVLENDNWDEEINLMKAEDLIEYLQENYEDILEQKENEREEKLELLKGELKEYMLNDETFLICSNKSLRRNYAETLIKNKKVKKYLEPFISEYSGQVAITSLVMFVEVVWAEFRNRRY